MANQAEIEAHYDTLGPLHALRMEEVQGGYPDYTCAFFDGDFKKTYKQAQLDKHTWIFDHLGLSQNLTGKRILDIGCGWGPMLNAARKRGSIVSVGLTLSPGQFEYCKKRGLDVRLKDYKDLRPGELGVFDGIVSVGSLEAFCSIDDKFAGKQEEVYKKFFKICAERLPQGGRLFVQTMIWGKAVPDYHKLSLKAPIDSTEAILARMEYLYPNSWLPDGLGQLVECAKDEFDMESHNNGRLDYIETLKCWHRATANLWKPRNLPHALRRFIPLAFNILTRKKSRIQWQSVSRGDQSQAFIRELMSHERIFFVKK